MIKAPAIRYKWKLSWGRYRKGDKKVWDDEVSFDTCHHYMTKYGVVIIHEWKWKNRSKNEIIVATEFETVVNGVFYEAVVNAIDMSERKLKLTATAFIKSILKQ